MRAENAIQHNFQYLYIDEYKTRVDSKVKYSDERAVKHFLLPKSNSQHGRKAFSGLIFPVLIFSQQDGFFNNANSLENQPCGYSKDSYEDDLLNYGHDRVHQLKLAAHWYASILPTNMIKMCHGTNGFEI
jgi:hypothetical protein